MEHGASVEVAAALDERDTGRELARSPPCDDRRIGALHPLAVRFRDVDRGATESLAPLDHRAVEVRMREGDGGDSPASADRGYRVVVDVSDAVPENVAARRSHEQRALPDAERRGDADSDESGLELALLDPVVHQTKLFETSTRVRNAPFARPRMCAGTSRWRGTNA